METDRSYFFEGLFKKSRCDAESDNKQAFKEVIPVSFHDFLSLLSLRLPRAAREKIL